MATTITIRNVPEGVRDELATRAARSGRSLQEYLLAALIDSVSKPDPETVILRARERARLTGSRLPAEAILAAKDADRR